MNPRLITKEFKDTYSLELINIARGDLESAKVLGAATSGRKENICYLAEQTIEKSIKAVINYLRIPVPLVHDLGLLLGKIPDTMYPPAGINILYLNDYAAIKRYEEGRDILSNEEIINAIMIAESTLNWASDLINSKQSLK